MKLIKGGKTDAPAPTGWDRIANINPTAYTLWGESKVPTDGVVLTLAALHRTWCRMIGRPHLAAVEPNEE